MKSDRAVFVGRWRITSTEGWDKADLDLVVPAYIKFDSRGGGHFQFCALSGDVDYRVSTESDVPLVEWSWLGDDDGTEVCGRGWAYLKADHLVGQIFSHGGDEFPFVASAEKPHKIRRR
jgi:hypothetical protein